MAPSLGWQGALSIVQTEGSISQISVTDAISA
jgi:hypothetical protein